jgi:hypothetical protein
MQRLPQQKDDPAGHQADLFSPPRQRLLHLPHIPAHTRIRKLQRLPPAPWVVDRFLEIGMKNRRFRRRGAPALLLIVWITLFAPLLHPTETDSRPFYYRGNLYLDWLGVKTGDVDMQNRLSSRLKLTLWNRPGNGWSVRLDVRDRHRLYGDRDNQFILYDLYLNHDSTSSRFYLSLGHMNLYDTAGIGTLLGAAAGYKIFRTWLVGAYGGIQPEIYETKWDFDYRKFGLFVRHNGPGARSLQISVNNLSYNGQTERRFIYGGLLLPLKNVLTLYGNLEYELAGNVKPEDRLSRIFLNLRLDLGRFVDLLGSVSSGRGLDYHRYIMELSKDITLRQNDIERYYYSKMTGLRASIKPVKNLRLFVERRDSEQADLGVLNHTWRLGLSAHNLLNSGISFNGVYNFNRGDLSESDYVYLALGRTFGRLSWYLSFATTYNGVRYDTENGEPQIVHLENVHTLSTDFFYYFNRALAVALQYEYNRYQGLTDHVFFVRLIYRGRQNR